jgi:DNA-binding sugar fermentation-stimulating protein
MSKIRTVDQDYVHNPSTPLLELPDDIVIGEIVCRPSKRNKSPYVADVLLMDENRQAIVHVPNLDMGGKSIPGAKLLVKPARDPKGNLVGPNAVNPKYGTPKCEFHAQLLRVEEDGYEPTWVGAHPNLGERITEQLIERHLLCPELPKVASYEREVRNICGTNMRADFVVKFANPRIRPRIVEVKTVVDTDYEPSKIPPNLKCRFVSTKTPYKRTAIFPWGSSNQKGPDGEKVVSARAIKHVQELTQIAQGKLHEGQQYDATVLFIIIRKDAKAFRPNHEACPSFSKYLKQAQQAGVQILAKQVQWGEGDDIGKCMDGPLLDIEWPDV